MHILNLSIDTHICDSTSAPSNRILWYGDVVDQYDVVVVSKKQSREFRGSSVGVYGTGGGGKLSQFFRMHNQAVSLLKKGRYDVITTQDPYMVGWLGARLAKKYDVGLEVQVHGHILKSRVRRMFARITLKRAGSIRVVSERVAKEIQGVFGIARERIHVIPVYSEAGEQKLGNSNIPHKPFRFLSVQRLEQVKNVSLQVHALSTLVSEGVDVALDIVGDGSQRGMLGDLVREKDLERQVTFSGWLDAAGVQRKYADADCFLLTSFSEGWPLVIMEAGACGLPVVMTDVGSAGELVVHGESGWVVPVNNVRDLVGAMRQVVNDSELRGLMSKGIQKAVGSLPSKKEILSLYVRSWKNTIKT